MKRWAMAFLMLGLVSATRGDDPPAKGMMPDAPGAEHRALAKLAGEYTIKTVMRMGDAAPQESAGRATIASQLDGRFISEHNQGEMMGRPYTSFKVYGFNNGSKKYEGFWAWTGGTSLMNLVGTSTDGGKTINFTGSFEQSPGNKSSFAITMKRIDDDHFTVEMGAKNPDGSPGSSMLTTYTRKK